MGITLTVGLEPRKAGGLELVLTLENRGLFSAPIYARGAQWSARSGWVGPRWTCAEMVEVRGWYGPPGHPPMADVWKGYEDTLAPGKKHVTRRNACLMPRGALTIDDPEGMDGLAALALPECAILVLDRTPEELTGEFPRSTVIVPFPKPGRHTLVFSYWQQESGGFFQPKKSFITGDASLEIDVP
jgi:hypothetical protein